MLHIAIRKQSNCMYTQCIVCVLVCIVYCVCAHVYCVLYVYSCVLCIVCVLVCTVYCMCTRVYTLYCMYTHCMCMCTHVYCKLVLCFVTYVQLMLLPSASKAIIYHTCSESCNNYARCEPRVACVCSVCIHSYSGT